jgi:hypothetical protein
LGIAAALLPLLGGCVTKAEAQRKAREAFIAGQQETFRQMQLNQTPSVTFMGPVKNATVPWTIDLTLAHALLSAEYTGRTDPREIVLIRRGVAQRIDPQKLLAGDVIPLQAGDIIQVK